MNDMIKLTGLWKGKARDGNQFLSGNLTYTTKVLIFANKFKESENDPDYHLYISLKKQKKAEQLEVKDSEEEPF